MAFFGVFWRFELSQTIDLKEYSHLAPKNGVFPRALRAAEVADVGEYPLRVMATRSSTRVVPREAADSGVSAEGCSVHIRNS